MFWIPRLVREIQEPGTAIMPLSGSVASGCCDYAQHDMGVLPHDVVALPHDVMALPHDVAALPHVAARHGRPLVTDQRGKHARLVGCFGVGDYLLPDAAFECRGYGASRSGLWQADRPPASHRSKTTCAALRNDLPRNSTF